MKLAQDLKHSVDSVELRAAREMLPAAQEAHELRGGDRLNFTAQPMQREPVNPRENSAMAELEFRGAGREAAAQNLAFGFELRQSLLDRVQRNARRSANSRAVNGPMNRTIL